MTLVIGLGNPGAQYKNTRHNVGWWLLDAFGKTLDGAWKTDKKIQAKIFFEPRREVPLTLLKPYTFMNNSGAAVVALMKRTQGALLVVHDDIDLPLGTVRVSSDASAGGHNGVQSIIDHIGTKDFWRLRIGVAPDREGWKQKTNPATYVLKTFTKTEQKLLGSMEQAVLKLLEKTIQKPESKTIRFS